MTYLRNPREPFFWESDGDYNGLYKAQDGTLCESAKAADKHDGLYWNSELGRWMMPDRGAKRDE